MTTPSATRRLAISLMLSGLGAVAGLAARAPLARHAQPRTAPSPGDAAPVPAISPYIEAHTHFDENNPEGAVQAALEGLKRQNAAKIFFLSPPDRFDHPGHYDIEVILAAANKHPGQLVLVGGGGTLNAMIQQSVETGDTGAEVQQKFKERAEGLLREGAAGFGEMTAEHFAGITPYQYAPADHPLFLLLADIAAAHDVPIDLHMEAVPHAMALPADLKSPPNAPQLHENIPAFERLLEHNPRAKIIWAHAGSDYTGYRTPDLCRRLLRAHPNLYMEIKYDPASPGKNPPIANGEIKPEWLKLFEDFPDRFVIGSDQHYPEQTGPQRWEAMVLLFNQLPADLRRKIGTENVLSIYSAYRNSASRDAAAK